MRKTMRKTIKRAVSMLLVTTLTLGTIHTAYASEGYNGTNTVDIEKTGVPYVLQCEKYDSQCGSSTIDGELVETSEIATLHDGIMSMLDEDTVINTNDYLGNSVISNEKDTYSTNMYNANAGTVNLSEVIVAENTIGFGASEVNGDGAVLYSKNGDINFYCGTVNFTGVIYAPNGTVRFEGSNINIDGVVIAKNIIVRAGNFSVKHNNSVAELVDILDYMETNEIYGLGIALNEETENNLLQWEKRTDISSVDVYARYDESGFEKIANVVGGEYEVNTAADYRIVANTLYGEKIESNIVTLVKNEEGYLHEDTVDTDADGIPDGYEYLSGTDANIKDTDEDGFEDGYEVFMLYTNPVKFDADEDFDGDGVKNLKEAELNTNPYLKDSDFDGINDNEDVEPVKTNVDTGVEADYTIPVTVGVFDLVTKYVDENGNKCELVYNYLNGQVKYMSDSKNESFNIYNQNNQLVVAVVKVDGNVIPNTYSYVEENIETITHNDFQYQFQYDENGNMTDVMVGDRTLLANKYLDNQLVEEQYGNGHTNQFVYDENGNVTAQMVNGKIAYEWKYDENGNVIEYNNILRNETFSYIYNEENILTNICSDTGFKIDYIEDESYFGVSYEYEGINKTQTTTETEETDEEGKIKNVTTTELISKGKLVSVVTEDNNAQKTLYINDNEVLSSKYTYSDLGVSKIEYQDGKILEYAYDNVGNIVSVSENGTLKLEYEYDSLGQLTRENNAYADKTYTYEYDNAGNILEVSEYAYCAGQLTDTVSKKTYEYGDNNWKDLLTYFNGQAITYDEIGNPLNYRDDMKFSWAGRQLSSVVMGNNEISYTYNSNGIRTSKTVNGVVTNYNLEGTKIISETTEDTTIWYLYDENDMVVGFEYENTAYYFEKNAQGDIIRIFDENGNVLCEYIYDAWGNVESVIGDAELAKINPFRYRGYYQDNETGFYYLQSRYYDAEIGRFLNADIILGMGNNLYTYCNNNPVNSADHMGYFGTPIQWICAVVGGIAGWYFGDYIAKKLGLFDGKWYQWQTYAYWAVRGLVVVGGSIVGYVAGTKLLSMITTYVRNNPNLLNKLPAVAKWFLGLGGTNQIANEMYARYASHIFSADHIKNGIMKLGANKSVIFDKIFKVVTSNIKYAKNGSNQIHTYINGYKVTVRFYFKDGELKSLDAFMGWANRVIGNLIK